MKQMTEVEISRWVMTQQNNDNVVFNSVVDFARHVGALKEPVVKYQYVGKHRSWEQWNIITKPLTNKEIEDLRKDYLYIYEPIEKSRTEE
jgi:hypothetical protein